MFILLDNERWFI